jgi:hypothetical protein
MTSKRTVNGQKFDIAQIVDDATTNAATARLDMDKARQALIYWGHRDPSTEAVTAYAQEVAILAALGRMTGANFPGQIGKIRFASREQTISDVESYLNRRIQGQHARWTTSH